MIDVVLDRVEAPVLSSLSEPQVFVGICMLFVHLTVQVGCTIRRIHSEDHDHDITQAAVHTAIRSAKVVHDIFIFPKAKMQDAPRARHSSLLCVYSTVGFSTKHSRSTATSSQRGLLVTEFSVFAFIFMQ